MQKHREYRERIRHNYQVGMDCVGGLINFSSCSPHLSVWYVHVCDMPLLQLLILLMQPLHEDLYTFDPDRFFVNSFLEAIKDGSEAALRRILIEHSPGVFTFSMLKPSFCTRMLEEVRTLPETCLCICFYFSPLIRLSEVIYYHCLKFQKLTDKASVSTLLSLQF